MVRRTVQIVEPQEPDYEVKNHDDVIKAMLQGHIDLDNVRFDSMIDMVKEIKKKIDLVTFGIIAAVGTAVLNLVIHH